MPNSYKFYRVITANEGNSFGAFPNWLGNITGSVMMVPPSGSDIGYLYVHGTINPRFGPPAHAIFAITIHFGVTPPVVVLVRPLATEGTTIFADGRNIPLGHIGTGACNSLGEYVTTFALNDSSNSIAIENSPGVYLFRPGGIQGTWSRLIGFADEAPDGSLYGGDFGDVAVDDNENLLLVAATTQSPSNKVSGFSGSQALIATSYSRQGGGRVVLQTGDLLPSSSATIESVGIVDLAADHAFAAQVSARLPGPNVTRSGTALIVGNTQAAASGRRTVAASPELISVDQASRLRITSGHTFFGPRVDPQQDVAYVTHVGDFQQSIGSNNAEILGYYSRGSSHLLRQTQAGASSSQVIGLGAPCIDSTGLMYGTELMGDGTMRLFISDGQNSEVVLNSGDPVTGLPDRLFSQALPITEILFGQHSTQVDTFGRIAFAAEFLRNPNGNPQDPNNIITGLVIGIPE